MKACSKAAKCRFRSGRRKKRKKRKRTRTCLEACSAGRENNNRNRLRRRSEPISLDARREIELRSIHIDLLDDEDSVKLKRYVAKAKC